MKGKPLMKSLPGVMLLAGLCIPLLSQAAADPYSLNVNISGTIVSNGSCKFNQGGTLNVDFGQVKLQGSGQNTVELQGTYQQPLTSSFTCTGDTAGLLQMKLSSVSNSYDSYQGKQVLTTDKGIVGIELLVDGNAQNAGEWFNITPDKPPVLKAQLVQLSTDNSKGVVSGNTFSASGTLTMAFN
ncbi:fimbrial protein [Enterobacteriaceae bacterium 89]|nr:fimbrial protein [Enterobacteriaceae bacterium 89]